MNLGRKSDSGLKSDTQLRSTSDPLEFQNFVDGRATITINCKCRSSVHENPILSLGLMSLFTQARMVAFGSL